MVMEPALALPRGEHMRYYVVQGVVYFSRSAALDAKSER